MMNLLLPIGFILELILVIWAFADIFKRREKHMLLWMLVILIFPIIGSIVYFQISGRKRIHNSISIKKYFF